jgi:hypothetical protein
MFIGVVAHERMFYKHDIRTEEGIGWKECALLWNDGIVCSFSSEVWTTHYWLNKVALDVEK